MCSHGIQLKFSEFLQNVPPGQFPGVTQQSDMYLGLGPICRYADDLEPMLKCMAYKDGPIDFNQTLNYDVSSLISKYKMFF